MLENFGQPLRQSSSFLGKCLVGNFARGKVQGTNRGTHYPEFAHIVAPILPTSYSTNHHYYDSYNKEEGE